LKTIPTRWNEEIVIQELILTKSSTPILRGRS